MSCSITITSLEGIGSSPGGTFSSVRVIGTISGTCTSPLIMEIKTQQGVSAGTATGSVTSGQFDIVLNSSIKCEHNYEVTVSCGEHCSETSILYLACATGNGTCCIRSTITVSKGGCFPGNEREVVVNVSGVISDPNCLPYSFELDFGDGSTGGTQFINTAGSFSFSETHMYDASVVNSHVIKLIDHAHPDCVEPTVTVEIEACVDDQPPDCCPVLQPSFSVGNCLPGCNREVIFEVSYQPPAGTCQGAVFEWEIFDKNGIKVEDSPSVNTDLLSGSSPNTWSVALDPGLSPFSAKLKVVAPFGCPEQVIQVIVPECEDIPKCPENVSLIWTDEGCERNPSPEGPCKRKIKFIVEADIFGGCGDDAQDTEFEIDFGDGSTGSLFAPNSGVNKQHSITHYYTSSGPKTVVVTARYPTGCQVIVVKQIDFKICEEKDCPDDVEEAKCVICKFCSDVISAVFRRQGRSQSAANKRINLCCLLVVLLGFLIGLDVWLAANCYQWQGSNPPGWINPTIGYTAGLLGILTGVVLYFLLYRCNYCCLFCALIFGAIIGAILIIVQAIFGAWPPCIFTFPKGGVALIIGLIVGAIAAWFICREQRKDEGLL